MLRKVKLYGELAKFVGHSEFEVKVDTVGKAVSFLIHNFRLFGYTFEHLKIFIQSLFFEYIFGLSQS